MIHMIQELFGQTLRFGGRGHWRAGVPMGLPRPLVTVPDPAKC